MAAVDTLCMACDSSACDFKPLWMQRRPVGENDILIETMYCGVCHSDLHSAAGHLKKLATAPRYPFVPGHELAGVVIEVGTAVRNFKVGDHAGVGCMVDSCLTCKYCLAGEEQNCKHQIQTYGMFDVSGRAATVPSGRQTMGGYTTMMVIQERFAILIPRSYPLEKAGPVMCAGITSYEPLKKYGAKKGTRVGIIGLGGLGGIAVKLSKALECDVTVISRSMSKATLAKDIGADHYIASSDQGQMYAAASSFDIILDFIPSYHDYAPYASLLAEDGKLIFLGLHAAWVAGYARGPKASGPYRSSFIGGVQNTQEVINLCDKLKIYPEVTVLPVDKLNNIFQLLDGSNESGTRYVLDIKNTLTEESFEACTAAPPTLKPSEGGNDLITVSKELVHQTLAALGSKRGAKCFQRHQGSPPAPHA